MSIIKEVVLSKVIFDQCVAKEKKNIDCLV